MKLKKLFQDIPNIQFKGPKDTKIFGICNNSALVSPGDLFIAKKGLSSHGNDFIPDAIASGAVAILSDLFNPFHKGITQIIHPHPASIEALLANRHFQNPSQKLLLAGITGTNGKTSIAYILKHFFDKIGKTSGLIGTIEYLVGMQRYPASHTTPDVISSNKLLCEMHRQGCQAAVMEVSSHALDQRRVEGLCFDIAIFSNLSQDHLDYHKDMQDYCDAKAKLFDLLEKKEQTGFPLAIINSDDPWSKRIVESCNATIISYGFGQEALVRAEQPCFEKGGSRFTLSYQGQKQEIFFPMPGKHNIYNLLAVIASALSMGVKIAQIESIFGDFPGVPGRLEKVSNDLNIDIYVDYAHTPDALETVLKTLQEIKKKKLITVFGCGGNRDRDKRPQMAAVVERHSDLSIVTCDNPRKEKPEQIFEEILKGFSNQTKYKIEPDRKEAIKLAIEEAKEDDIILIAGKGHETRQSFACSEIFFDDRQQASELCKEKNIALRSL